MSVQDQIVQMIFDELGRTDRELAFNIEKLIRADEREQCVQRVEKLKRNNKNTELDYYFDDQKQDWIIEHCIEAIRKAEGG